MKPPKQFAVAALVVAATFAVLGTAIHAAIIVRVPRRVIQINEERAIASIEKILEAEERFRDGLFKDFNFNQVGEYGYLAELGGTVGPFATVPSAVPPPGLLDPSLTRVNAVGFVLSEGYYFAIFLPSLGFLPRAESPYGGAPDVLPDIHESTYVLYAWPEQRCVTGIRSFAATHDGTITFTHGQVNLPSGLFSPVGGLDAYEPAGNGDMKDDLSVGIVGNNGDTWERLR